MIPFARVVLLARSGLRYAKSAGASRAIVALAVAATVAACSRAEDRAQQHYRNGLEYIAKGDDLNARTELSTATKFKPDWIEAWRAQVDVNERIGAPSHLFQALRRVVELDPKDEDTKIRLAKFMLRGGGADAALKMLESVTGSDQKAEFHGTKAAIYVALKDGPSALQEAKRAAEIDPTNADAALILASERVARNDAAEALKLLSAAKPADPKDSRIALARIELYARTNDLPRAEAELRALIEKNSKDAALRTRLVQLLVQQRRPADAEKELRAIAELTPAESKPVLDLVRFIVATRGPDAGRQELQTRVSKGGETFPYEMALAEISIGERKLADATSILERLAASAKSTDDKNTAKVKLAEVKLSQREMAGAEPLIGDVLNADRRNVGALRLRAAIRLDRGEVDAAVADLREALNEQPKGADLLLLMAQAYERNGQKELAERQYADAVKATEFNPAVVLRYAAFLQRDNSAARAEEILVQASLRNPQSVEILSSLAQVRLSRQNWTGALAVADVIARNDATKALADQLRAAALAGQNKPDESIAALEHAHAAAPNALPPIISLVRAYVAQKSYDKAETLLRDMLGKAPGRPELLVLLGQVQGARNNPAEAIKSYEAAIAVQPKDPGGYAALAGFYSQQKKTDEAIAVVERGLKELPQDASLRLLWAGLQDAKGAYDAAIQTYEALVKEQPNSLVAINNLASMLLDHRTDKESLDRAQALVEKLKGTQAPQFLDTVGWALHLRGDQAAAKPMLEQAKSQLQNVASVRYHLGLVYRAVGEEPKATEELKAALLLEAEDSDLKRKIRAALN